MLLVADNGTHVIQVVDLISNFSVQTLAGNPTEGAGHRDGRGAQALFDSPSALAVDRTSNTLLVVCKRVVRRVTLDGVVFTLYGDPNRSGYSEGIGSEATFDQAWGATVFDSHLFLSDNRNHCVRKLALDKSSPSQVFAGTPQCFGHTPHTFTNPKGLDADDEGNVFVADVGNHCIRKISTQGTVSEVAGSGKRGRQDGSGSEAGFNFPFHLALDGRGNLLVADCYNSCIRTVEIATGKVETLLDLTHPGDLVVDMFIGVAYVVSEGTVVRFSLDDPGGSLQRICGTPRRELHEGEKKVFCSPTALALM